MYLEFLRSWQVHSWYSLERFQYNFDITSYDQYLFHFLTVLVREWREKFVSIFGRNGRYAPVNGQVFWQIKSIHAGTPPNTFTTRWVGPGPACYCSCWGPAYSEDCSSKKQKPSSYCSYNFLIIPPPVWHKSCVKLKYYWRDSVWLERVHIRKWS